MKNQVLLFEDNPINSRLMKMFLEQLGFFVELALSYDDLAKKLANTYAVVFIDITSPAFAGVKEDELRSFVKASKASVSFECPPLVAIMNSTRDADIRKYMDMGMNGYIVKPISIKSLRELIDRLNSGKNPILSGDDMVDFSKLTQELGISDQNILKMLFTKFFESASQEIRGMKAAAEVKDYAAIRNLAHSVKGSSRNLRLINIGKLAEELENETKYPAANLDVDKLISALEGVCARLYSDYMKKYS